MLKRNAAPRDASLTFDVLEFYNNKKTKKKKGKKSTDSSVHSQGGRMSRGNDSICLQWVFFFFIIPVCLVFEKKKRLSVAVLEASYKALR